ncbi:hypothetical protein BCU70_10300 [Vibrio sp. 10N.286.49.C2]|nr:hypothetical protein BCU70_10300 [Vibrio sp. 10N.286.49.C2]PMH51288.1 hypothetical protein BCU66_17245 [Vibrio sp. 10N.286.49.B1]PMH81576.1 hypothetical protein BCU58_02425 [Vibrio sp. 10N.286.48.B7]
MQSKRIVMVITSQQYLGYSSTPTGLWLDQFIISYYTLVDRGVAVTLCSLKGGQVPIDPLSVTLLGQGLGCSRDEVKRFEDDIRVQESLAATHLLSHIEPKDYSAVVIMGGYGGLCDLSCDPDAVSLLDNFYSQDKPICTVGHASGVLINVSDLEDQPIVAGKNVTGYSNKEEMNTGRAEMVPFLVEDELIRRGAIFHQSNEGGAHVEMDGLLITGQNSASCKEATLALLGRLNEG